MKYGFLGLGIMGRAMAANLIEAGHHLVVWNRDVEKCGPLVELGAARAESPRAVAETCDVTFAMLSDPAASESVALGPHGVVQGIRPGAGYVDMSTIDGSTSGDVADAVHGQGGRYLEAPVSGSKKPAEDGSLVILAAGDRGLYDEVTPAFEIMGKKHFYLGQVGQAARMKLVVNMIMGGMMTAFSEGLGLAAKGGIPADQLLEVLASGAVANPMFALKGPTMAAGDFEVAFPLKHMEKDLRLALDLGGQLGQALPTAEAVQESFAAALEAGLGDHDFSAVFRTLND
jgi:3-hydroxyisobutyrate dehydrogenase-like beta-hydroxyacid dehydrogenase